MQFFLNGFHSGDPFRSDPAPAPARARLADGANVDVLVVGSGPAGLVLAAQLARFQGVETRVVEQRDGPLPVGQADGVACRTVEMLHAFGVSEQLLKEACWVNEVAFWEPDPADPARIRRGGRILDHEVGLSEFPHVVLNQTRVHDHLLSAMRDAVCRLEPDYGIACRSLELRGPESHPVAVRLDDASGSLTMNARYVVGCDGARSAVRQAIGCGLHGDAANHAWGVMDVLADTDFPDTRLKCAIQSANAGNILLIPREGGYLMRLYVDLGEMTDANRAQIRAMTAEQVAEVANRIFFPYALDIKQVAWFSVYEVAQRLADAFDGAYDAEGVPRVFIAGDACHTHSAKAGQGMNVSMQDAFNLGWKLGAVLEGRSPASLLRTYSAERRPVAAELIDFDREWSALLAAAPYDPAHPERGGVGPDEVQRGFLRQSRYTAGVATRYQESVLTAAQTYQHLAAGFPTGMRFHSVSVVRVADTHEMHLAHSAGADGRWRLYAFADAAETRLRALCDWLQEADGSPVRRFTPADADADAVFDLRAVLQRPHADIRIEDLPDILHPRKGRFALTDREKVFTDDPASSTHAFDERGINRGDGCLVIVRPDQYVAAVLALDAFSEISAFFDPIMVTPADARSAHQVAPPEGVRI